MNQHSSLVDKIKSLPAADLANFLVESLITLEVIGAEDCQCVEHADPCAACFGTVQRAHLIEAIHELLAKDEIMSEEESPEIIMWSDLLDTYRKLKASKPNDRSEKDRRMAVAITKYEDLLAWYFLMVIQEFEG